MHFAQQMRSNAKKRQKLSTSISKNREACVWVRKCYVYVQSAARKIDWIKSWVRIFHVFLYRRRHELWWCILHPRKCMRLLHFVKDTLTKNDIKIWFVILHCTYTAQSLHIWRLAVRLFFLCWLGCFFGFVLSQDCFLRPVIRTEQTIAVEMCIRCTCIALIFLGCFTWLRLCDMLLWFGSFFYAVILPCFIWSVEIWIFLLFSRLRWFVFLLCHCFLVSTNTRCRLRRCLYMLVFVVSKSMFWFTCYALRGCYFKYLLVAFSLSFLSSRHLALH